MFNLRAWQLVLLIVLCGIVIAVVGSYAVDYAVHTIHQEQEYVQP